MTIEFDEQRIVVKDRSHPRERERVLEPADITEIVMNWFPCALRTLDGDFVSVPRPQALELHRFGLEHSLSFVNRMDVWSLILDPFLDTEFSDEVRENTLQLLEEVGLSRERVASLRSLVRERMLLLTCLTWEWNHYGLMDVLAQMRWFTFTTGRSYSSFYAEAMEIANLGSVMAADDEAIDSFGARAAEIAANLRSQNL